MTQVLETISDVCGLLEKLPLVTVVECSVLDGIALVRVTVGSLASRAALQRECQGANVELDPWVRLGEPTSDKEIRPPASCMIRARTGEIETIQFGNLQLLGIHLAWHLRRVGILERSSASVLLARWNAPDV